MRTTPSTNLGKMADSTKDRIGRAITMILTSASKLDELEGMRLGLLGTDLGLTDKHLEWLEEQLTTEKYVDKTRVPPFIHIKSLSSRNIEERLEDKNKIKPKQLTVLVKQMGRHGKLPGQLIRETVQSRTEFSLTSAITKSLIDLE